MKRFLGTGVALVTPFKADASIDFEALERLVNFQIDNGVNYLVVLGTTGEPATLSEEEKEAVKSKVIEVNDGRLPLVLGVGGNNTAAVVNKLSSLDVTHFDAVLSVSPYYNKPTQEGIYQHFKAVAEASSLPIILYNVPGRTASNMTPDTIIRLATDFDNIIGVKEAAGDIVQAMNIIKNKPENFLVISGDDMIALPMVLAGGAGVISVIAQALPTQFSSLIQLGLEGESQEAYDILYQIATSIDLIFEEGNPAGIKAMLEQLDVCSNEVRLPLVKASGNLQEAIDFFLKEAL